PDFGGLIPVDPEVTDALTPALKTFEDLGATIEATCPDLSDADHVFRVKRAWQMELSYGQLLDEHRDKLKPDAVWNIEEGRRLLGSDVGAAERMHATLYHRTREFFDHFDILLSPVSQVVPFHVNLAYPLSVNGVEMTTYLDWMAACYLITVTGCP